MASANQRVSARTRFASWTDAASITYVRLAGRADTAAGAKGRPPFACARCGGRDASGRSDKATPRRSFRGFGAPLRPAEMREKQRFPRRSTEPAGRMGGVLAITDPRVRLQIGNVNLRPLLHRHCTIRTRPRSAAVVRASNLPAAAIAGIGH